MTFTYIKFEVSKTENPVEKEGIIKNAAKNIIKKGMSSIFPVANPDFEDDIDNVQKWYLEYDTQNDFTNREVGLNSSGKSIIIMPWKKNYGYWIDTNMKLDNFFSQFNAKEIDKKEFERCWKEFEDQE